MSYSGGKKNPDLPIKTTENLNMTCRHCKRLVITPPPPLMMLCCVYSRLYKIALRILYIRCCELNYIHFLYIYTVTSNHQKCILFFIFSNVYKRYQSMITKKLNTKGKVIP